jgi:hypothetical protein
MKDREQAPLVEIAAERGAGSGSAEQKQFTQLTAGALRLPREARHGLMRAWLEILNERHPEVTWVARSDELAEDATPDLNSNATVLRAA